MSGIALAARLVLAVVFGLAGAAKLADFEGSRRALEGFGLPRRLAVVAGALLPVAELVVAGALLVPATAWWAAIAGAALLLSFVAAIAAALARGDAPDCHCFGQVHSAPAGWGTLGRNAVLLSMAGLVAASGQGEASLSPVSWVPDLPAAEIVLAAIVVALVGVAAAQGWFLFELLRQNGRILTRLERLENCDPSFRNATAPTANGNGHRQGLPVGAPAPGFALTALDGEQVSLAGLRAGELPVMLVFSDPGCGPCNALLPEIAAWQIEHQAKLTLALVSRGDAVQNQAKAGEHGLVNVLLQEDREVAERYQAHGTPAAVLVAADGRIGSALALGPQAIKNLVGTAADSPLEESFWRPRD